MQSFEEIDSFIFKCFKSYLELHIRGYNAFNWLYFDRELELVSEIKPFVLPIIKNIVAYKNELDLHEKELFEANENLFKEEDDIKQLSISLKEIEIELKNASFLSKGKHNKSLQEINLSIENKSKSVSKIKKSINTSSKKIEKIIDDIGYKFGSNKSDISKTDKDIQLSFGNTFLETKDVFNKAQKLLEEINKKLNIVAKSKKLNPNIKKPKKLNQAFYFSCYLESFEDIEEHRFNNAVMRLKKEEEKRLDNSAKKEAEQKESDKKDSEEKRLDNSVKKEAEQKKSDKKDSEENSQNKTAGTELSLKK